MSWTIKATAVALLGALTLSGCASASGGGDDEDVINIVGFAVPEEGNKAIAAEWNTTEDGKGVRVSGSYGASGDQSRKVVDNAGRDVDYVHFSLEPDLTRLVDAGLVAEDWNSGPNEGIVPSSVAVIAVEPGNELGIEEWTDLTRPGVKIITPDPASSGSAKWNVLAMYTGALDAGMSEEEADEFLIKVFGNVVTWAASGREATEAFQKGVGNVLITYENEAILARQNGEGLDYVIPSSTFRIDNPGAVLKDSNPKAKLWLDYVLSETGQTEYAKKGFRPVGVELPDITVDGAMDASNPFPEPSQVHTVAELGGWGQIYAEWFGKDGAKLRFDQLYEKATKQ